MKGGGGGTGRLLKVLWLGRHVCISLIINQVCTEVGCEGNMLSKTDGAWPLICYVVSTIMSVCLVSELKLIV